MTDSSAANQARALPGNSRALGSLLISLLFSWISFTASMALIGWLVFERAKSPALVSVAFAIRFLPLVFTGVVAGALSDRFGPRLMLAAANGSQALVSFALAIAAATDWATAPVLILASGAYGLADSARLVSGLNLTYALADRSRPLRGMAWANVIASGGQALGGLVAAGVLSRLGPAAAASTVGAVFVIGAMVAARVQVTRPPGGLPDGPSLLASIKDGISLLGRARAITLLFSVAVVTECFAFSGVALDPVFAGSVFVAGPVGLSLILLARGVGRIVGSVILIWRGGQSRRVIGWIAIAVGLFGAFLLAFATAPTFPLALLFVCGAGAAAGIVDVGEQTAMQESVDAELRGRAAGLWVLAVGLGPLGLIEVGGLAQAIGARATQAINGGVVAVFGLLLVIFLSARRLADGSSSTAADRLA